MRESNFVKQNQEKWSQFEKELSNSRKDPDKLRAQLIQTTDDLSYARTFYKNRSVRVYLNGLAQNVYINIYKNRKNFRKTIVHFFKEEIPSIAWQNRKTILISFLLLLFSTLIGAFSSAKDEQFARSILSDAYVDQTLDNIRKGDPFGIYKDSGAFKMFFAIALNNLQVSLFVFLAGIFACYGSVVLMIRNGIMLGVFMYFFYSRGLAAEFNLTVFLHGTIEMLTLVIETTAGMLLGRGLIYPGTLSRYKAFSIYGRKGALLFLSTVPFILFAAFIESFLTRFTDMPNILRGAIILFSLFIMVYYFAIYPYLKFRNSDELSNPLPDLKPDAAIDFQPNTLYSNGQIFLKTIQFFSLNFQSVLRNLFLVCLLYFGLLSIFYFKDSIAKFELLQIDPSDFLLAMFGQNLPKFFQMFKNVALLFNEAQSIPMFLFSAIWMAACCALTIMMCQSFFKSAAVRRPLAIFASSIIAMLVLNLSFFMPAPFSLLAFIAASPVIITLLIKYNFLHLQTEGNGFFSNAFTGYGRAMGIISILLLLSFFGFVFILSPLSYFFIMMMEMNIELSDEMYTTVLQCLMIFSFMLVTTFSILFFIVEMYFFAHVVKESGTAESLNKGIDEIGKINKAYGIEVE